MNLSVDRYSVFIPLCKRDGEWNLVYEVRSRNLNAHGGEISFPGGRAEEGETLLEAALRETVEELGVEHSELFPLKEIPGTSAMRGFWIHCYAGLLFAERFQPSEQEVAELFEVPLDYLLCYEEETEELFDHHGQKVESHIYRYGTRKIWGITGRLTKNFIDRWKAGALFVSSFE